MKPIRTGFTALLAKAAGSCALLLAAPLAAADADLCRGHWVRDLAGPLAVTREPMADVASLRQRLPELEASIRAVVARDPTLGPAVADALLAAIRDGSQIGERPMRRDEAVIWMAYQPQPGRFDAISPACLRLERDYEAFEITVEVPDPASAAQAAQMPTCSIAATRSCAAEDRVFTVDLRGSSANAQVTLAIGGAPAAVTGGPGQTWTVADPGPYDRDATLTVRAAGGPVAARTARVLRFLMPKACGNLAYLGESAPRTIAPASAPTACEQSVVVSDCGLSASLDAPLGAAPTAQAGMDAAASPYGAASSGGAGFCAEGGWIVRPFFFGYFPTGDARQREIDLIWTGPARESFELGDGFGIGASLERRLGPVFGVEGAVMIGRGSSEYILDDGNVSDRDSYQVTFQALTLGVNFHLLDCGGADLYLGPFLGYGGFADPIYWVSDHRFVADLDRRFLWGAQIGLDLPFGSDGPWGIHGGLRYMDLSQDSDAGSLKVDPLLVELGLFYRF